MLWRLGNGDQATAFGQQRFGNSGNFANGLVLVLQQQYLHGGIPTIVLALLASRSMMMAV